MEKWTHYSGAPVPGIGMWDIANGITHGVVNGMTLCGRNPVGERWNREGDQVSCKQCRRAINKKGGY